MQKKPFITSVRMLIAAGSFVGFVGGWTLLAQAGQAADESRTTTTAMVESAPTQPTTFVTTTPTPSAAATATPTPTATAVKVTTTSTTKTSKTPPLRTGGS